MDIQDSFVQALNKTKTKTLKMFSSDVFFQNTNEEVTYIDNLNSLKNQINDLYLKNYLSMGDINPQSVQLFFEHLTEGITQIKDDLIKNNPNAKWLNIPVSMLNNAPTYSLDMFLENFQSNPTESGFNYRTTFQKFLLLKEFTKNLLNQDKKSTISEDTYKSLVEEKTKKIVQDFNLNSIQFVDSKTWQQKLIILQEVYNQITTSHNKIGLATENIGLGTLNIVISDDFLLQKNWEGFQSETNNSHSIFINSSSVNMNQTWIHEYTHFLDRVSGKKYNMEHNTSIECYSHIALNALSNNQNIQDKPLKIMAETMSAVTSGLDAQDYLKQLNSKKELAKKVIALTLLLHTVNNSDHVWDRIKKNKEDTLLYNPILNNIANKVLNKSFSMDNDTSLIKDYHNTLIIEKDLDINEKALVYYLKKEAEEDRTQILKQYKLSFYSDPINKNDRFFFIEDNFATFIAQKLQQNEEISRSYFDKPLELFARMVESLQNNILSEDEYQTIKENNKTSSIPTLNKEERMITCAAIHNLARYVGIKVVEPNLDQIPCLRPENIDEHMGKDSNTLKFAKTNQMITSVENKKIILHNIDYLRQKMFDLQPQPTLKIKI